LVALARPLATAHRLAAIEDVGIPSKEERWRAAGAMPLRDTKARASHITSPAARPGWK